MSICYKCNHTLLLVSCISDGTFYFLLRSKSSKEGLFQNHVNIETSIPSLKLFETSLPIGEYCISHPEKEF